MAVMEQIKHRKSKLVKVEDLSITNVPVTSTKVKKPQNENDGIKEGRKDHSGNDFRITNAPVTSTKVKKPQIENDGIKERRMDHSGNDFPITNAPVTSTKVKKPQIENDGIKESRMDHSGNDFPITNAPVTSTKVKKPQIENDGIKERRKDRSGNKPTMESILEAASQSSQAVNLYSVRVLELIFIYFLPTFTLWFEMRVMGKNSSSFISKCGRFSSLSKSLKDT